MSLTAIASPGRQCAATGAVVQTSTSGSLAAAGSEIDTVGYATVSYTISVATHDVDWAVQAGNVADYSDAVSVLASVRVASGGVSSYTASPAPYRYYRVLIIDDVGGTHGVATVNGLARA